MSASLVVWDAIRLCGDSCIVITMSEKYKNHISNDLLNKSLKILQAFNPREVCVHFLAIIVLSSPCRRLLKKMQKLAVG